MRKVIVLTVLFILSLFNLVAFIETARQIGGWFVLWDIGTGMLFGAAGMLLLTQGERL